MKLFFISDIHGNQFALEAILKKAVEVNSDRIYCLGDISGYFTGLNEVIKLLKKYNVSSIKGNHDAFLTNDLIINKNKNYYSAFLISKNKIGTEDYNWINNLTEYKKIKVDNFKLELYHGGLNDKLNEYVFPNLIDFKIYKNHTSNLFLFGHTHLQFVVEIEGKIFANPGSVGLPRNGDFRSHGLLFDTQKNMFFKYKVFYDLNKFNSTYINDTSINEIYLHNINFGRSSSKPLLKNIKPFLDQKMINYLESNNLSLINTTIGLVLAYRDVEFLNNLLYVAAYSDGSLIITSNTLIFNWEIDLNIKSINDLESNIEFKKDKAGIHYYRYLPSVSNFKMNILNIIMNAFEKINNI
jgi:putative phosphoesterase